MKPDWDRLGDFWNKPETLAQIADVDCTTRTNEELCEKYGVDGYPTIKFFTKDTPDTGEVYEGKRSYNGMKRFIRSEAKLPCVVKTLKNCNKREQTYIDEMAAWSQEDINGIAAAAHTQLKAAQATYANFTELFDTQKGIALATDDASDVAKALGENMTRDFAFKISILDQRLGITVVEPMPEPKEEEKKAPSKDSDKDDDFGSDELDTIEL